MQLRRRPPQEPPLTISYGRLTVKDALDRDGRLMFCIRCGAVIPISREHTHSAWHRKIEQSNGPG